jgi:hypothetical protein
MAIEVNEPSLKNVAKLMVSVYDGLVGNKHVEKDF